MEVVTDMEVVQMKVNIIIETDKMASVVEVEEEMKLTVYIQMVVVELLS